jgi:hypothetical protein
MRAEDPYVVGLVVAMVACGLVAVVFVALAY